jgi:hypothetical protein
MNNVTEFLVEARVDALRREAQKARSRAMARDAARSKPPPPTPAVTIRFGTAADAGAVKRLAQLDSSGVPANPLLLVEVDGEVRAAVSLDDRTVIADPFQPAEALVQLLLKRADQLLGDRVPRLRRLRDVVSRRRHRRRRIATNRPTPELP